MEAGNGGCRADSTKWRGAQPSKDTRRHESFVRPIKRPSFHDIFQLGEPQSEYVGLLLLRRGWIISTIVAS